jgi:hypothetical protein
MISREAFHNFRNARGNVVHCDEFLTDAPTDGGVHEVPEDV